MRKHLGSFFILIVLSGLALRSTAQQATSYRLTLRDAIEKGLQANLSVLASSQHSDRGSRRHAHTPPLCCPASTGSLPKLCQFSKPQSAGVWNLGTWFPSGRWALLELRLPHCCRSEHPRPAELSQLQGESGCGRSKQVGLPGCSGSHRPLDCSPLSGCAICRRSRQCRTDSGERFASPLPTGKKQARRGNCDGRRSLARPSSTCQRPAGPARGTEPVQAGAAGIGSQSGNEPKHSSGVG